jgi:ABC-type sugar transport systems, permease components
MKSKSISAAPRSEPKRGNGRKPAKDPKEKMGKMERRERRQTVWFLLPSIIGILVFFVIPYLVVVYYSLVDNPINHQFVFLDNFKSLMQNSAFQLAVKNTLRFSLVSVPLVLVLSLLCALILDTKLPFKTQFRTVFITPLMVPVASIVLIWQVVFHQNGVLNEVMLVFGQIPVDWLKSEYSQYVIVLLYLWKNLGYNMILFMSALANIPRDVLEASSLEGAGPIKQFFLIKLRYLSSTLLFVGILSLIGSFKIFREVYLLTGSYPYDGLYLLQHFINNTFGSLDYQKLSAAALIMCAAMIILIGLLFLIDNRVGGDIEE